MQAQAAFALAHIEAVAKVLQSAYVGTLGLLAVDLQLQLALYERGDALPYALSCATALAEDKAVVGIAHKGMAAPLKLAPQALKGSPSGTM